MKKSSRQRMAITVIAILLTSVSGGAFFASAGGNFGPIESNSSPLLSKDAIAGQALVMQVLDPLTALVNPLDNGISADGVDYGFAGVKTDPLRRTIDLYLVGDIQPKVQEILDAAPPEVTVMVHPAKYRLNEMLDAVNSIFSATLDKTITKVKLIAAGPEVSGSGIWVRYAGDATPSEAIEYLSPYSSMPISSAEKGEPTQPSARWDDGAPYDGGAGYYAGSAAFCSTSFTVQRQSTGTDFVLSANHCFTNSGTVAISNDSGEWGTAHDSSAWRQADIDAALIRPTTQSINPKVFYGTWSTTNKEVISAIGGNAVGNFACTDGANSGNHCLVISQSNFSEYISETQTIVHGLVEGSASSNAVMVVGGDSGGPVVYPVSAGTYRAMGTILGGSNLGSCPPVRFSTSRCYTKAVWVGAVTISNEMGVTIKTG